MDDATLKRLGIRQGGSGQQPKVRYWAKHGTRKIESFGVQVGSRLEVRVDGKTTKTRSFKTAALAAEKFFWAQYWARNAVDQFLLKLVKKVTAEKRRAGAIPKEPKTGYSCYASGDKVVVLAHAPEGLARFNGSVGLTGFVVARATWKKGASAADAQKVAESLLRTGFSTQKPPAGLQRTLGWRVSNMRKWP